MKMLEPWSIPGQGCAKVGSHIRFHPQALKNIHEGHCAMLMLMAIILSLRGLVVLVEVAENIFVAGKDAG